MKQFRKALAVTGSVGQMLGLAIAIFLLTQTGRASMVRYGWLNVLIVAVSIFLILELVVMVVAHRMQQRASAGEPCKGDAVHAPEKPA